MTHSSTLSAPLLTVFLLLFSLAFSVHSHASSHEHLSLSHSPIELSSLFPQQQVKRCDNTDPDMTINPNQPLVLIIHGCFGSAGQFKALAGVYEHLGQQAICYEYNDRRRLDAVSGELIDVLNTLGDVLDEQRLIVLGHSQGGLITRRALTLNHPSGKRVQHKNIDIATVSSPFNGIEISSHCGTDWLRIASLGIVDAICYLVTGEKYLDIPPQADFIQNPGKLAENVSSHLVIKTDETGTCRTLSESGHCSEDDYVFSVTEQTQPSVEGSDNASALVIPAGHVEIVGGGAEVPWKLIDALQDFELMDDVEARDAVSFAQWVNHLYLYELERFQ